MALHKYKVGQLVRFVGPTKVCGFCSNDRIYKEGWWFLDKSHLGRHFTISYIERRGDFALLWCEAPGIDAGPHGWKDGQQRIPLMSDMVAPLQGKHVIYRVVGPLGVEEVLVHQAVYNSKLDDLAGEVFRIQPPPVIKEKPAKKTWKAGDSDHVDRFFGHLKKTVKTVTQPRIAPGRLTGNKSMMTLDGTLVAREVGTLE